MSAHFHSEFGLARTTVPPVDDAGVVTLASILAVAPTSVENSKPFILLGTNQAPPARVVYYLNETLCSIFLQQTRTAVL